MPWLSRIGGGSLLLLFTVVAQPALAGVSIWDGGGSNDNWSNPSNWASPLFPIPSNDGTDDVIMAGTSRLSPLVDQSWEIQSLQFNSTAGPFAFQAGGEALFIREGGITNNDADLQILSRVHLGANHTWNAAVGPLQVNFVTLGPLISRMLTVVGSFDASVQGTVSGSALTNSGSILLNSTANFTLAGNAHNTFAGPVTVHGGALLLNKPAGINAVPGSLAIGDGAGSDVVKLLNHEQIADTSNVTVNGAGILNLNGRSETVAGLAINGGLLSAGAGTITVTGPATISSGSLTATVGRAQFSGGLALTSASVMTGAGALGVSGTLLTGASNTESQIAGRLDLSGTINVADGPAPIDLDISAEILGPNTFIKRGAGVLRFSGAEGGMFTQLTVAEGTLLAQRLPSVFIRAGDSVGGPGADVFRFEGGGSFGGPATKLRALEAGLIDLNDHQLTVGTALLDGGRVRTGTGTLVVSESNTPDPDLVVNEIGPGTSTSVIEGTLKFSTLNFAPSISVINGSASIDLDLACSVQPSVGRQVVRLGGSSTSVTRLSGAAPNGLIIWDQYEGTLVLQKSISNGAITAHSTIRGVLRLGADEQVFDDAGEPTFATVSLMSGTFDLSSFSETTNRVALNSSSITTAGGTLTLLDNLIVNNGSTPGAGSSISGNLVFAGSGNRLINLSATTALDLDIPASISGTIKLVKQGAGAMRLSGNNSFTGGVEWQAGTLILGSDTALGTGPLRPASFTTIRSELNDLTIANVLSVAGDFTIQTVTPLNWTGPIDNALVVTKTGEATLSLSGLQSHFPGAALNINAGNVRFLSDAGASGANLDINLNAATARVFFGATQHLASLDVNAGTATLEQGQPAKLLCTSALSIDSADALIDIWEHAILVDYTGASPMAALRSAIVSARNGGAWNGKGITSSLADAMHGVGYAESGPLNLTSFEGEPVDDSAVLIKFTYLADTNLDGQVDITDLGNLATNWQTSGVWTSGDFNYDGFVDITDLGMLATNWQAGVGSPLGPESLSEALGSLGLPAVSVPEPAVAGMLIAWLCLGRRQRR